METSRTLRKVIVINLVVLIVLVAAALAAGIAYLNLYRDRLIDAEIARLQERVELIADSIGASALIGPEDRRTIDKHLASALVRRFAMGAPGRLRLYSWGGLIVDSRKLVNKVTGRYLPPASFSSWLSGWSLVGISAERFPPYQEPSLGRRPREIDRVLDGNNTGSVQSLGDNGFLISVATPISVVHHSVGAIMLSVDSSNIEESLYKANARTITCLIALIVFIMALVIPATYFARPKGVDH